MKYAKYLFVLVVALALCIPVGLSARGSDDPEESPEASESESPEVSGSHSPSVSPDDEDESENEDEDKSPSVSPGASSTPDDEDEDEDEIKSSSTPRASSTVRPARTPEQEDENEDESGDDSRGRGKDDVRETPRVSVPPELEDDVDEAIGEDEDVTEVEIDEDGGSVEVKYRLRAKLFGFIDVPYELDARVETKTEDGTTEVKTRGPWWLLFARDNADEVQSALEDDPTLPEATNQGTVLSTILGILKALSGK